eukprot:1328030-Prymnesium_polylepis.1
MRRAGPCEVRGRAALDVRRQPARGRGTGARLLRSRSGRRQGAAESGRLGGPGGCSGAVRWRTRAAHVPRGHVQPTCLGDTCSPRASGAPTRRGGALTALRGRQGAPTRAGGSSAPRRVRTRPLADDVWVRKRSPRPGGALSGVEARLLRLASLVSARGRDETDRTVASPRIIGKWRGACCATSSGLAAPRRLSRRSSV